MNATAFSSSPWYQAATLTERLAALRVAGSPSTAAELQADLGQQELQRWRSQPPFGEDRFFEQRLAADGLTQQEMLRILGEPIQVVGERWPAPPDWLARMHQAFACPRPPETSPFSADEEAPEMAAFLDMIEPLITQGRQEVRHGAAALAGERLSVPFDPATVEEVLFKNLPWQLCRLMDRTLVLELHVARIQGLLQGETPSERFASFHERLRHPEPARAFLEEYPVLARQLVLAIDHWVRFSLEFLRHLAEDWDAIRELFHPSSDPGLLAEVEGNAGDSHRGGRAVLVARFASGFRLVYKPKSMAVDRHFQDLLAWVNERDDRLPFRILKILDLEDHGWVEFIEARSCSSTAEVERFYERQGGYLALLYALEAMDFHCENLIAAGEHPVLIDLEALFHPRTERPDLSHADAAAWDRITHSVLNVSLLPQRIWAGDDPQGVDISGIGAKGGQLTPHPVPQWEEVGTDAMRFTRQRVEMPADANRPLVGGADVEVMDYAEFIVKGFTRVYRLLERSRDELLADAGPLARFADDEVRVIMRATQLYSVLRSESFHPDVLRNALDRDRLFDRLWIGIDQNPNLARVIPSERDDLWQGDIPMFTTRAGSRDLWDGMGRWLPGFFEESGLTLVQRRLRQFGDEDLDRQLWVVRASLASVVLGGDRMPLPPFEMTAGNKGVDPERLLAAARAVGDRLEERAIRGPEGDVTWINLALVNDRYWSIRPLGVDLYDGLSGVALFLGYLGRLTGEERYTVLARAALAAMRHMIRQVGPFLTGIGAFDGWGGVIYTLAHLGKLWKQPELFREAEELAGRLPALIEDDKTFDVIAGSAGCIGALLTLYRVAPAEQTLASARQCGDHLLARAQPMAQGVGWPSSMPAHGPLTGFSHGTAGIAWALLELAEVSGDSRYRRTALDALTYERSLFSAQEENWPDLRLDEQAPNQGSAGGAPEYGMAWCHGAPGIGLGRLGVLRHVDDAVTREEIEAALRTTLAQGFGHNHTLCHGDLGNLELILEAGEVLDDPRWRAERDRLAASILESTRRDGWRCAIPFNVETPGLMTGLAGIGYGLLRLADPRQVPSVLLLASPF